MTTAADYRYQKQWRIDRARGIRRTGPTSKARAHIESLAMAGASYRGIADAAGVSVQSVCKIRDGQSTAKVSTLRAILAVQLEDTMTRSGGEDFVLNIGAKRRIQALMRIGHTAKSIGAKVGKPETYVYNALHQQGQWISRDKHYLIVEAYDALSMTPGSSSKSINLATQRGYLPPLAWDDDGIDDPNAQPDAGTHGAKEHVASIHLEDIEDCIEWGLDLDGAAQRLRVDRSAIEHRCARTDRRDLLASLARNKERTQLRLTVAS